MRPPVYADADAVLAVLRARDLADLGEPDWSATDLAEQWSARDCDLARDARVVEADDGQIVAYAIVRRRGAMVTVAPDHEQRGAGSRLLPWVEGRQRERGAPRRQWLMAGNQRGRAFLEAHGYRVVREDFRMTRELSPDDQRPRPPRGIRERAMDAVRDPERLQAVDEAAFTPTGDYLPESVQTFRENYFEALDVDPQLGAVAEDEDGPVGFVVVCRRPDGVAHIDILAVHPRRQGEGIGTFMLRSAYARLRAAGLRRVELSVAGDNAVARHVYERAGMTPRFTFYKLDRE